MLLAEPDIQEARPGKLAGGLDEVGQWISPHRQFALVSKRSEASDHQNGISQGQPEKAEPATEAIGEAGRRGTHLPHYSRLLHVAAAIRRLCLPPVTILAGIGFDPCQRAGLPLSEGKALQIRFDRRNLRAEKLHLRVILSR